MSGRALKNFAIAAAFIALMDLAQIAKASVSNGKAASLAVQEFSWLIKANKPIGALPKVMPNLPSLP